MTRRQYQLLALLLLIGAPLLVTLLGQRLLGVGALPPADPDPVEAAQPVDAAQPAVMDLDFASNAAQPETPPDPQAIQSGEPAFSPMPLLDPVGIDPGISVAGTDPTPVEAATAMPGLIVSDSEPAVAPPDSEAALIRERQNPR